MANLIVQLQDVRKKSYTKMAREMGCHCNSKNIKPYIILTLYYLI